MIVKVEISKSSAQAQATITSQDKTLVMHVLVSQVERRMNGALVGFFRADYARGVLELDERIADEKW